MGDAAIITLAYFCLWLLRDHASSHNKEPNRSTTDEQQDAVSRRAISSGKKRCVKTAKQVSLTAGRVLQASYQVWHCASMVACKSHSLCCADRVDLNVLPRFILKAVAQESRFDAICRHIGLCLTQLNGIQLRCAPPMQTSWTTTPDTEIKIFAACVKERERAQ